MAGKSFVDTNILIYLIGDERIKKQQAEERLAGAPVDEQLIRAVLLKSTRDSQNHASAHTCPNVIPAKAGIQATRFRSRLESIHKTAIAAC